MSYQADTARSLYLELRALGFKVWVEDDPDGGVLDYRLALDDLRSVPEARARRVRRQVLDHQNELVRLILDRRDPDLDAVRKEGHC